MTPKDLDPVGTMDNGMPLYSVEGHVYTEDECKAVWEFWQAHILLDMTYKAIEDFRKSAWGYDPLPRFMRHQWSSVQQEAIVKALLERRQSFQWDADYQLTNDIDGLLEEMYRNSDYKQKEMVNNAHD